MADYIQRTELRREITSLITDRAKIKSVLLTLEEKAIEAMKIERDFFQQKSLSDSNINMELIEKNLDRCAHIMVDMEGSNGERLYGTIDDVFADGVFPEKLKSIYTNSQTPYKAQFDYTPRNHFELLLDFTKPKIFDFSIQPGEQTPNNSFFKVDGQDSTWVNGVYSQTSRTFLNSKTKFIHKGSAYNIVLWLLGYPFALWCCYTSFELLPENFKDIRFLDAAFMLYIFLASLVLVRLIFHYFRWVYPVISFKTDNDNALLHRAILYTTIVGIFGKFIYDIIKYLLSS